MPGDRIDEPTLASRLGVSRTPVREAVQQLKAQGLVQVVPRQGVYVARLSIRSLLEMFELLGELESICAKLATRRLDVAGREALKTALEACRRASTKTDSRAYVKANDAFHRAIYDATRNPFLVEQVLFIRRRTQMYRRNAFQQPGRIKVSLADHERLAQCLLSGNAESAAAEALAHIAVGGQGFADFVSTVPEGMLLPGPLPNRVTAARDTGSVRLTAVTKRR